MLFSNLTALTRETLLIQQTAKACNISPRKTFQNFTQFSFIVLNFNLISLLRSKISPQTTALQCFKKKAMAEMNSQFTVDEDQ